MTAPPAPLPAASGWTLRRRLALAFAISGVIFAAVVTAAWVALLSLTDATDDIVTSRQPAMLTGQRLLTDVRAEESALGLSAHNPVDELLRNYQGARAAVQRRLGELRRLTATDQSMTTVIDAFDRNMKTWRITVADPVVVAVQTGGQSATALVDAKSATSSWRRVQVSADAVVDRAEQRVQAGRDARSVNRRVLEVFLAVGAFVVILAGVVMWRGLHRWVLGPIDRLGAQTRIVAAGATRRAITPDGPKELATLGGDVEAMRKQIAEQLTRAEQIQEELTRRGSELSRSNADLQQFAYVASHDLSEPLRKVANFCQLLERQYGPQLDDRAHQYIEFAVDGARRMQVLIADLLALSRVGRTTEAFVPVDLNPVIEQVEANLSYKITESKARIDYGRLPIVYGDAVLLGSLFGNLIGNAIKYRRPGVEPAVHIRAEHESASASWQFTVADNGIGIEPQYAERIFAVFQRLHLRDEYGGTGIGLAMCRKIIDFHGGRIWLDTTPDAPGASFRFTLPEGGTHAAGI